MYFLAGSIVDGVAGETGETVSQIVGVFLLAVSRHWRPCFALPVADCKSLLALQAGVGLDIGCLAVLRQCSTGSLDRDEVALVAILAPSGEGCLAVGIPELADPIGCHYEVAFALDALLVLPVEAELIYAASVVELEVELATEAGSSHDVVGLAKRRDLFAELA